MDLFCESMDSYRGHKSWLQKGSIRALQNESRICIVS